MPSFDGLQRTLTTTDNLYNLINTLKTLSAVNIRQHEMTASRLKEYIFPLEQGLQIVLQQHLTELIQENTQKETLALQNANPKKLIAIVFGSDIGFCGRFNESVVDAALAQLRQYEHHEITLIAIGSRTASELNKQGYKVNTVVGLPNSQQEITHKTQDILLELANLEALENYKICLYYHAAVDMSPLSTTITKGNALAGNGVQSVQVYPLDRQWLEALAERPWESRTQPQIISEISNDWRELFTSLLKEHFFVSLYRALVTSLLSENTARLLAMQRAEKNVLERLDVLRLELNEFRQRTITEELLDITIGANVIGPKT